MNKIIEKILHALNPVYECKKYRISVWQCPSFLFLLMGLIIVVVIIATYFIATLKINNPKIVSLIVLSVAFVLVVIDYIITRSFERLSEANRIKTEFINITSHNLRAPLTNLRFTLETILSDPPQKTIREENEYLEIFKENIERMNRLINNLLIVSRLGAEKLVIKNEDVYVPALVKEVVLSFKNLAESSNVKLFLEIKKSVSRIEADKFWLKKILENVIDNAIRYIKENGEVKVSVYRKKNKMVFQVSDTGFGIPKGEQKFIFQKFFRSGNAMRYQTSGSGLSLYISKKILKIMNGKIWFKSEENKGSSFFFYLPIDGKKVKSKK